MPEYKIWCSMKTRCYNTKQDKYEHYGGSGITVCDRWLGKLGYDNFIADMGERPEGYSIDRIDCKGNYEPTNCRWVDQITQANNKSNNVRLELCGVSKTLAQWSRVVGISQSMLSLRRKKGWTVPEILGLIARDKSKEPLTNAQIRAIRVCELWNTDAHTQKEIANMVSLSESTVSRILSGKIHSGITHRSKMRNSSNQ